MINRNNWLDVKAYISYIQNVRQNDPETVRSRKGQLRHLLEWSDQIPLTKARSIDPTYPVYLSRIGAHGTNKPLSPDGLDDICNAARMYFSWAKGEYPVKYKEISDSWIFTIRPSRAHSRQSVMKKRVFYTLEDVKKICSIQTENLIQKRDKAAVAFLFLSGMRSGAFLTLPINCLDLDRLRVYQLPEKGVHTKNHKAAVTAMFNIPALLEPVKEWNHLVRTMLPDTEYWYSAITSDCQTLSKAGIFHGEHRHKSLYTGFKVLCSMAGIEYKSPHKLRHGHAVHGIKNVSDMAGLKKLSQNLMHGSITITDSIYAEMTSEDVADTITSIGEGKSNVNVLPDRPDIEDLRKRIETIKDDLDNLKR